jgi:hypothetical protein
MIELVLLIAAFVCFVAAFFGWGRGIPAGLALWVFAIALLPRLHS